VEKRKQATFKRTIPFFHTTLVVMHLIYYYVDSWEIPNGGK